MKNTGNLCFITPSTFLRQPRYGDLRRLLLENGILQLIDLGENIFEAVVPTAISLISKKQNENVLFADLTKENDAKEENDIPILIGKDINKYFYVDNPSKKLRHNYLSLLKQNEGTYYNKKIMNVQNKLIWRQTSPYFIGTILNENIFFGNTIQAGIIKEEFKDKVIYEYLCGLLNSKYLRYLYEQNVKEKGRVFPQVKLEKLKILPIIVPDKSQQQPLITLVNQTLSAKKENPQSDTSDLEKQIDKLVYELYGLTEEEIKIIGGYKF